MPEVTFLISELIVGIVVGISFRAGNPDLGWTRALRLWFYVALLLGAGGALAIYTFGFDAYRTGRIVGGAWVISLLPLRFFSSAMLSAIGLANVTAAEKPRIVLAGCLISLMLIMILNAVNI